MKLLFVLLLISPPLFAEGIDPGTYFFSGKTKVAFENGGGFDTIRYMSISLDLKANTVHSVFYRAENRTSNVFIKTETTIHFDGNSGTSEFKDESGKMLMVPSEWIIKQNKLVQLTTNFESAKVKSRRMIKFVSPTKAIAESVSTFKTGKPTIKEMTEWQGITKAEFNKALSTRSIK